MPQLIDYRGEFKPNLRLEDFEHQLLAQHGRDIMLANHIHDRSALSPLALNYGRQAQTAVACDEWMSSSPVYSQRNRKALHIPGDDVGAVLKAFQVDIGAPHNFLNLHYDLVSAEEGYFWTSHCGPHKYIHDISGGDEEMQVQICHHMEDPTFDATVMAVNPRIRCRPVFRPPHKEIPQTGPCKWRVEMRQDIGLAADCPNLKKVKRTLAANFEFSELPGGGGGMDDYSGGFKRDFRLSDLSHNTLATQCKEFLLHVFLLNYACYVSIAERFGEEVIVPLQREQWRNLAPVTVHRLRKTFGIEGDDMSAALKVIQLNPFVPLEYFRLDYALLSETHGRIWLQDCAAVREPAQRGLASLLVTSAEQPGFDALAHAVNPRTVVTSLGAADGAVCAWDLRIDAGAEPAAPGPLASIANAPDLAELDNSKHRYFYHLYD